MFLYHLLGLLVSQGEVWDARTSYTNPLYDDNWQAFTRVTVNNDPLCMACIRY